jgi:hypothetical protein
LLRVSTKPLFIVVVSIVEATPEVFSVHTVIHRLYTMFLLELLYNFWVEIPYKTDTFWVYQRRCAQETLGQLWNCSFRYLLSCSDSTFGEIKYKKKLRHELILKQSIGCTSKFPVQVGVEESIVNAPVVCMQSKNTNNAKSEVRFK